MKIIETVQRPTSDFSDLSEDERLWVYNGLDTCITMEVHEALKPKAPNAEFVYKLERAMQGPAFTMMNRGILIDKEQTRENLRELEQQHSKVHSVWDRLCLGVLDSHYLYSSPLQLKVLFFEDLRIPEIKKYDRASQTMKISTDRQTLEQIQKNPYAKPFCELILELRDLDKKLQVLRTSASADGRMRCSYQVAGPYTGRWSSNADAFGDGTNLQNISDMMRRGFIPDEGKKLCSIDLAGAESVAVAHITLPYGGEYLEGVMSGDIHTYVASMVWPEKFPPTSNRSRKAIAKDTPYYRDMSLRDTTKRLGHGSNYYGTPAVMSQNTRIPVNLVEQFQIKYFRKFPGIPKWHAATKIKLATSGKITTAFGRYCNFLGRSWDKETINAAVAYEPQSFIGDTLNVGMYKVWKEFDSDCVLDGPIQLLLQVHDDFVFQYDPKDEAWLLPAVQKVMQVPIVINGKLCSIPSDVQVGWNWGKRIEVRNTSGELKEVVNEFGLADFKGSDSRVAPVRRTKLHFLDRRVCEL